MVKLDIVGHGYFLNQLNSQRNYYKYTSIYHRLMLCWNLATSSAGSELLLRQRISHLPLMAKQTTRSCSTADDSSTTSTSAVDGTVNCFTEIRFDFWFAKLKTNEKKTFTQTDISAARFTVPSILNDDCATCWWSKCLNGRMMCNQLSLSRQLDGYKWETLKEVRIERRSNGMLRERSAVAAVRRWR